MLFHREDCLSGYFGESLSLLRSESGSKNLVSTDDLFHRPLQPLGVERTAYTHTHGDMIDRAARMNLLQEPESLLREAERHPAPSRFRGKRYERNLQPAAAA
jgi:hypothetical protein